MTCKRCGQCCWVYEDGQFKDCKHLERNGHISTCKIYGKHIGVKIAEDQTCDLREKTKFDYLGCPYNTSKPIMIVFKNLKRRSRS